MSHISRTDVTTAAIAQWRTPTRRSALQFRAKAFIHQAVRGLRDLRDGPPRLAVEDAASFPAVLGESRTPLWPEHDPRERQHELGKVHNLRRAVWALDRIVVPAGAVFSFWRQVGRASRRRGFVPGRMLQEGCLMPAIGGGLCQLSNALYDVALQTGCEIVERHAHSRIVPGSAAANRRDATIAWNYVDLRFRAPQAMQLETNLSRHELVVRLRGRGNEVRISAASPAVEQGPAEPHESAESCATCGEAGCFRHRHHLPAVADGVTAFLVDENWPELQEYVAQAHGPNDVLGMPLDGARWRLLPPRYRWNTQGFAQTGTAAYAAVNRVLAMRRLPTQGAARRAAELQAAERIAARLARLLTPEITRVYVAQSLLPYLWRDGHLGGREIEVLMTRLPMAELQTRLDAAKALHPERATLDDFRAPSWIVAAEMAAVDYAASIVTPHHEIAQLFADKAVKLDWRRPTALPRIQRRELRPDRIAFPGPTIARKGAYEVREAARALALEVVLCGGDFEGLDFWAGVKTVRPDSGGRDDGAWLDGVGAVVQPALVEDRPRHLLSALAAAVPVVATKACGLPESEKGLTIVPESDPRSLITVLQRVLG